MVPQPTIAVLMVFPITEASEKARAEGMTSLNPKPACLPVSARHRRMRKSPPRSALHCITSILLGLRYVFLQRKIGLRATVKRSPPNCGTLDRQSVTLAGLSASFTLLRTTPKSCLWVRERQRLLLCSMSTPPNSYGFCFYGALLRL